jgi:hypothetical protein
MTHAIGNHRKRDARKPKPKPEPKPNPTDCGLAVLTGQAGQDAEVRVVRPVTVATTMVWAQSVRRFGRVAIWAAPAYGFLYGIVTAGHLEHAAPQWRRLIWFAGDGVAAWFGVIALMALAALLIATRSRRTALIGLLVGTAGIALLLPVLGLAWSAASRPLSVTVVACIAGTLCSLGWLLTGSAVVGSGLLNRGDGVLLIVASPLVGVGGVLFSPLRTVGGLLLLAAGIGLAVTASRLIPTGPPPAHHAQPGAPAAPGVPVVPDSPVRTELPIVPAFVAASEVPAAPAAVAEPDRPISPASPVASPVASSVASSSEITAEAVALL